jgi:formyl-CoA transferase
MSGHPEKRIMFGQTGPYKDRPGFGTLAEAMSGFAHITGQPDGPPTPPSFALGDTTAALYATVGAMICLYQRDVKKTGRGQSIDVSLLESLYTMLSGHAVVYHQRASSRRMSMKCVWSSAMFFLSRCERPLP